MRRIIHGVCWVTVWACMVGIACPLTAADPTASAAAVDRPNILWIVSEDNGPYLGCYGDEFANTPRIDGLAKQGVLYRNAFANAPVCAPNRSTIITGCYASSLGTLHMRSTNRLPEAVRMFPHYLRQAGYYCSNNSKTDYNFAPVNKDAWNAMTGGHYRNREPGQPFFSVFNIGTSHESSLHKSKVLPKHLESKLPLPPYHPDTPEIRSNWVEYYDIITRMDAQVGQILDELERDGLADSTIVFYYADHGGILTRSKRFLYDTGVHIPMVARFPTRFQHLAPGKAGTETDRLVSCVDLAPTVLSLAGLEVPQVMQGQAFLGKHAAEPREYVHTFRGRMDERYDMMRGVHDKQFNYIRNYMPHRVYGQHLNYLWIMPATRSWEQVYKAGKANAAQRAFWEPKPTEELYDTSADPWEVNNLASDPKYQETLERMRAANRAHLLQVRDAGFLPEGEMLSRAGDGSIYDMTHDANRYPLEQLISAAETATGRLGPDSEPLVTMLASKDAGIRYWGAVGCIIHRPFADETKSAVRKCLLDPSPDVRIAAAEAVAVGGHPDQALPVLKAALQDPNPKVALHAINVLQESVSNAGTLLPAVEQAAKRSKDNYVQRAAEWFAETHAAP